MTSEGNDVRIILLDTVYENDVRPEYADLTYCRQCPAGSGKLHGRTADRAGS